MPKLFQPLAFLALVVALATPPARAEPCRLGQLGAVDLAGPAGGLPVVAGSVNGRPTGFVIDTGGAWSFLTEELAQGLPLGNVPAGMRFTDAAGATITRTVVVPELVFGRFKLSDAQFIRGAAPTLGGNILSAFDVEIDPAARKLVLFRHHDCDAPPVYWPHRDLAVVPFGTDGFGRILLQVRLDQKPTAALFDTGATVTLLDDRMARDRFGVIPGAADAAPSGEATALSGQGIKLYRHVFDKLEIGDMAILHPALRIAVHDHNVSHTYEDRPLVLGMSTLAAFHFYVAYREHKLYLTTDAAPAGP